MGHVKGWDGELAVDEWMWLQLEVEVKPSHHPTLNLSHHTEGRLLGEWGQIMSQEQAPASNSPSNGGGSVHGLVSWPPTESSREGEQLSSPGLSG